MSIKNIFLSRIVCGSLPLWRIPQYHSKGPPNINLLRIICVKHIKTYRWITIRIKIRRSKAISTASTKTVSATKIRTRDKIISIVVGGHKVVAKVVVVVASCVCWDGGNSVVAREWLAVAVWEWLAVAVWEWIAVAVWEGSAYYLYQILDVSFLIGG